MDESERGFEPLVSEVGVEARELRGGQHSLVDERPRRQARHHEIGPDRELGDTANDVQLALERVALEPARADDELADAGHRRTRGAADVRLVDRDVAPADQLLPLGRDRRLDRVAPLSEAGADAVAPRRRQIGDLAAEESVGDLDEDAGPVARVLVRARGSPVLEVGERDECPLDRLVCLAPVRPHDKGHAAGVVLERGVVQTELSTVRQGRLREERRVPPCGLVGGGGEERAD